MTNRLSDMSVIRDIMNRHGFRFSKSLGQNFIINPSICPKMAESCGASKKDTVIEIGPGIGVLTRELSRVAGKVICIELDSALLPVLDETLADCNNVDIIHGDILKLNIEQIIADRAMGEVYVCANLPYYITSPVVMALLEGELSIKSITVMVQKEAAQRFCAMPGTRECGGVSVGVRYRSRPEILFGVSRGSFFPPPNVDSAVVRFEILEKPPVEVENEAFFFALVKAAFSQRRKTAVNSISSVLGENKQRVEQALEKIGVSKTVRAEKLTIEQLADLANTLEPMLK